MPAKRKEETGNGNDKECGGAKYDKSHCGDEKTKTSFEAVSNHEII